MELCRMSNQDTLCIGESCQMISRCKVHPCDDCAVPMEQAFLYDEVSCYLNCKTRKEYYASKDNQSKRESIPGIHT